MKEGIPPMNETYEGTVGSEGLGCFFRSVDREGLKAEVKKSLRVIRRILDCSDDELCSREFLLQNF